MPENKLCFSQAFYIHELFTNILQDSVHMFISAVIPVIYDMDHQIQKLQMMKKTLIFYHGDELVIQSD